MAGEFDPYHEWLGIPPKDQPPHAYRLLGIETFESNPSVIENAADRIMSHLRSFQSGGRAAICEKLLNKVSRVRVALLDPEKKSDYDTKLRAKLGGDLDQAAFAAISTDDDRQTLTGRRTAKGNKKWLIYASAGVVAVGLLAGGLYAVMGGNGDETARADNQEPETAQRTDDDAVPADDKTKRGKKPPASEPSDPGDATGKQDPDGSVKIDTGPKTPAKLPPTVSDKPDVPPAVPIDLPPAVPDPPPPATEPVEPIVDPVESSEKKSPAPSPTDRTRAERLVREAFGAAIDLKNPVDKEKLESMSEAAFGTADDAAAQYVLFQLVPDHHAVSGDFDSAFSAVDDIVDHFDVDALKLRGECIRLALDSGRTTEVKRAAMRRGLVVIDEALATDQFQIAASLTNSVGSKARLLRDRDVTKEALARRNRGSELYQQHKAAEVARAKLIEAPNDPEANRVVGIYLCFVKRRWDVGLPTLAKCIDAALAAAARQDLSAPSSPSDQVRLADAWWTIAEKLDGAQRASVLARAAGWYRKALPKLAGLAKRKVEKRIEGLANESVADAKKPIRKPAKPKQEWVEHAKGGQLTRCYSIGPFPFGFDDRAVFAFLLKAKEGDALHERTLTRVEAGFGGASMFRGPPQPKMMQYYIFPIRTKKKQSVKYQAGTFIRWKHNTVEVYLDFRKISSSGNAFLSSGNHLFIVRQNHDHDDGHPERSWITFNVQGEKLEVEK